MGSAQIYSSSWVYGGLVLNRQVSSQLAGCHVLQLLPVLFEPAVTAALEDLLHDVHRLLSGLFEMGYVTGCLLAADCYRAFVPPTTYGFVLIWSSPPLVPPRTETFPRGESRA